jgi:hypothetical protein
VPNLVEKLQQNRNPQFSNFTNSLPHFIFRKLSQDIWWRLENIVLSNLSSSGSEENEFLDAAAPLS